MMDSAKRYISYRRVSDKKQGDSGLGLEAQTAIIKHFYPNIEMDFVEVQSGSHAANRPEFQKAIAYCKKHGTILVVAKADRFARNTVEALTIYDELKTNVRFCDIPGDPPDRMVITFYFAVAERELLINHIRIEQALAARKARGLPLGLHITETKDGRKLDTQRLNKPEYKQAGADANHLAAITDPVLIRAKQMAESLRASKTPLHIIAEKLNASHFPTRSGGSWSKGTVSRLLKTSV